MKVRSLFFVFVVLLSACQTAKTKFTVLQINDVYEIAPLENGKAGGLARVAHVRKELLRENPNTITVLAGDFLSPSLLGTLSDESGNRLKGKHMIETLNALGLDYATFGNHEFDIDSVSLQDRLNESCFQWISSNVLRSNQKPFSKQINGTEVIFPTYLVREIVHRKKTLKVGFIGITIPFTHPPHVRYIDIWEASQKAIEQLVREGCHVLIALTHLSIDDDKQMAQRFPVLHLILGGHDHQHMEFKVGNTVITKADANAKTVYIHRITYDWKKQKTFIESALKKIDDKIPHDPDTEAIVQKWLTFAYGKLESSGYRPREVIYRTDEKLDGLEYSVRHHSTNLTKLIIEAAKSVFPQADGVILNGGAIRLDDILTGEITQEDILRTMPFGDGLVLVRVQGDILLKTLEIGSTLNIGTGGFLHHGNIEKQDNQWYIAGKPISETQTYLITTSRFLSSGKERNLDFFNFPDAYCPEKIGEIRNDVRDILIHFLKSKKI